MMRVVTKAYFRRVRFCSSATNRLLQAKDKASVQINIGHVNGASPAHC